MTTAPTGTEQSLVQQFKDSMGRLACGVVIVTCRVGDRPWGLTVSACTSISAEPPTLMVSLGAATASAVAIREQGVFGVSILSDAGLAAAKAGSAPGTPKFIDDAALVPEHDPSTPAIRSSLAHLDCRVADELVVNDHVLLIGAVERVSGDVVDRRLTDVSPLVHFERCFYGLQPSGRL